MTFEFKRSLLRVSTLLLLVLFAIVGVGMGYYTAQYVGSQVDYKYSVIGFSQVQGDHVNLVVMAIRPNGDPAPDVEISAVNFNGSEITSGTPTRPGRCL
ncbi:hypothetical protein [Sulfuracidifex tepidarius]|uniref:hypothetical protein n=1 Tax=Sulfuracidifex tepidarius TaxID=1294262 RepID=UPI0011F21616|nr:hypothetical protein [Sulfuracidifex tepidarius]